jgi:ornithine cyclodeaminase/alanine dehydrogenase
MTLFLSAEDVTALATDEVVMEAARAAVAAEREGRAILPPRLDLDHTDGFLRVMPAAIDEVVGVKVMTLAKGLGTRYVVLVYRRCSGELIAMIDADEITRRRTAATTAVAGEMLAPNGVGSLALIGSGFEAEGHVRLFASRWPLERVLVYSRSQPRRELFAARMTGELGVQVRAVDTAEEAIANAPLTILATKSSVPVVAGEAFPDGAIVLSIGSTRPDLRELDTASLARAAVMLVDDVVQVCRESGDIMEGLASGALTEDRIVSMAAIDGPRWPEDSGRDLLTFKSVGTAVHDLSLSIRLIAAANDSGRGSEIGELTRLKPFAEQLVAGAQEAADAV